MTKGKFRKVTSALTIFAVMSTMAFSSSALSGASKDVQQNKDKEVKYATGLKEPTKEDLEWMKENMVGVQKVLPNEIGLKRVNEARGKKGLPALKSIKAAQIGQEVIPVNSDAAGTKKSSTEADLNDLAATGVEALGSTSLPTYVDNSKLPYFPPIRNQGGIGSCASFSTTYYQATHMTAMARGWNVKDDNDNTNKFSPKWTYNQINGGSDNGSTQQAAYRLFLENGIATWADFPYSGDGSVPKNYLEWSTDATVWKNAFRYKMDKAGYVKVSDGTLTPVTSPNSPALNDIKQLLNNGYVLVYSTGIFSWTYKTIKNNPAASGDDAFVGKSAAFMMDGFSGGHAMTVVGYCDDIWVDINDNNRVDTGETGAFRIANSWGDTWGDNGFSWIAYDALNKVSAVNGAPASIGERQSIWTNENLAYWITAKTAYTPHLIGEITLNHGKRNQLKLELGMQDGPGTDKVTFKPIAVSCDSSAEVAFDGTNVSCDATFAFDYSDMFKGKNVAGTAKNWIIKVTDTNLDGSGVLVKNFKVTDVLSGTTAPCNLTNQNIDGSSTEFTVPLVLQSNDTNTSEWAFKKPMPFSFNVHKVYPFNNKVYAIGNSPDMGSTGLICYDPLLEQTSWIRPVPTPNWMASVGCQNKIYVFDYQNVKEYNIDTGDLTVKSALPRTPMNAAFVELNGKAYLINGFVDLEGGSMAATRSVMVYDTVTDTWSSTADTNIARNGPNAAVLNGRIYLFGGYDLQGNAYNSIEEYNPATNQWTLISSSLPCPLGSQFIPMGNKIYALGMDNLNQVYEYDPVAGEWKSHDNIPEKYYNFGAASVNSKIYVLGGSVFYYSPDSSSRNILEFTPSALGAGAPVFSPAGGTYTAAQTVTLTSATQGASIRYTTDGTNPTATSTLYTGPITVSSSTTIKAIAIKTGMADSAVSSATYTITSKVPKPVFSLAAGTYTSPQTLTITCGTTGATIKYTTDGTTPTSSSSTYTGPITVSRTQTVKAYAIKAGMVDSDVTSATYTIQGSSAIKVEFYNAKRDASSNEVKPFFKLTNTGTSPVNLSDIKLRYYYTIDGEKAQSVWCDYFSVANNYMSPSLVTGMFTKMGAPKTKADYYLELSFGSSSGTLASGASAVVQIRFAKSDWSLYTQTNDYSFNATATNYVQWNYVTAYQSGALIHGLEP